jgi:tetraacyldisaccharide 4'-kinase
MKRPWLAPLMPLYAAGVAFRELRLRRGMEATRRLRNPVISIGNLSTGGAGKTPFAISLAKLLASRGFAVDVLSRGYGRGSREPARVRPDGTAEEFGDEPLLIARGAGVPVYVAPQRYEAGRLAEGEFTEQRGNLSAEQAPLVHILDDGFQHRQLARDIDILLLNRSDWYDSLLPAGNLREARRAAHRASLIAIPADEPDFENELRAWGWDGPIWRLRRDIDVPQISGPVVAFCGIARPEQFFAGLEAAGVRLTARIVFRDHHRYIPRDVERIDSATRLTKAVSALTTEKDMVRMGALRTERSLMAVGLRTEIEDEAQALQWLIARLSGTPVNAPL